MKKLLSLLGVLIFLLTFSLPAIAAPQVVLDGQQLEFEVPPIIENGRTLVPLRAIFEALGANVSWDGPTQTVTATKSDITIKLQIGSQTAYRNNEAVSLEVPGKIISNRTLVPLRFVSEALGATVKWDGQTQTISLSQETKFDAKSFDGIYLCGGAQFCEYGDCLGIDIDENKILMMCSINLLPTDAFSNNNLIIVSQYDSTYKALPTPIQNKITQSQYDGIPMNQSIELKVDKSTILIQNVGLCGIDAKSAKGIYLFGGKKFCEEDAASEVDRNKIRLMASIDRFEDSILTENNLIIISVTDVNYDTLPSSIKENVNALEYKYSPLHAYITLKVEKADILITSW